MKRIILFIRISMNLSAFEIKDNIGIFDENSKREFEEKVRKIENKSNLNFIFEYAIIAVGEKRLKSVRTTKSTEMAVSVLFYSVFGQGGLFLRLVACYFLSNHLQI